MKEVIKSYLEEVREESEVNVTHTSRYLHNELYLCYTYECIKENEIKTIRSRISVWELMNYLFTKINNKT